MMMRQTLRVALTALLSGTFTVCGALPAFAQQASPTQRFTAVLHDVLDGRTPPGISPTMKSQLTPAVLAQIDSTFAPLGAFRRLDYVRRDSLQGYQRFHYLAVFEKGSQPVVFVTDSNGTILGFFNEEPNTSPGSPPDSALTGRFQRFLEDLLAARVPAAKMSDAMKTALTGTQIAAFDKSVASLGSLRSLQFVSADRMVGYERYHYVALFEKGTQPLLFVTDADGTIVGFFKDSASQ